MGGIYTFFWIVLIFVMTCIFNTSSNQSIPSPDVPTHFLLNTLHLNIRAPKTMFQSIKNLFIRLFQKKVWRIRKLFMGLSEEKRISIFVTGFGDAGKRTFFNKLWPDIVEQIPMIGGWDIFTFCSIFGIPCERRK